MRAQNKYRACAGRSTAAACYIYIYRALFTPCRRKLSPFSSTAGGQINELNVLLLWAKPRGTLFSSDRLCACFCHPFYFVLSAPYSPRSLPFGMTPCAVCVHSVAEYLYTTVFCFGVLLYGGRSRLYTMPCNTASVFTFLVSTESDKTL